MNKGTLLLAAMGICALTIQVAPAETVIDDFTEGPLELSATGTTEIEEQDGLDPAHILGGARYNSVRTTSGSTEATLTISPDNGGSLTFEGNPDSWGYLSMRPGGPVDEPVGVNLRTKGDSIVIAVREVELERRGFFRMQIHWLSPFGNPQSTTSSIPIENSSDPYEITHSLDEYDFDLSRITAVALSFSRVEGPAKIVIDSITVEGVGLEPPQATTEPANVNFGSISVDDEASQTVTVTNTGEYDLWVYAIDVNGDDAFALTDEPELPLMIAEGEQAELDVAFDPSATGSFTGTLALETNDLEQPTTEVPLEGTAVQPPTVAVSPASIDFGSLVLGDTATQNVTIANAGDVALELQGLEVDGDDAFSIAAGPDVPASIAGGDEVQVELAFSPESSGELAATLQIDTNDPAQPTVSVPLEGVGLDPPTAVVEPASIDFGSLVLGDTATQNVTIANAGDVALTLESLAIQGDAAFSISDAPELAATIEPEAQVSIELTFSPESGGELNAELQVGTDDPNQPTLSVALAGTGLEPATVAVEPTSIDFDTLETGEQDTRTLTIANAGDVDLELEGLTIDGDEAFAVTDAPDVPATIAGGGEVEVALTFSPVTVGAFTGELVVQSSDDDQPTVTVALSGASDTIRAAIVVEPDDETNTIELRPQGHLWVAVLSDEHFDATTVRSNSVELGDPNLAGTASPNQSRERDVDGDGLNDLLLRFRMRDLVSNNAIDEHTESLVLTGETADGAAVVGEEEVNVVEDARDDDDDDGDDGDNGDDEDEDDDDDDDHPGQGRGQGGTPPGHR